MKCPKCGYEWNLKPLFDNPNRVKIINLIKKKTMNIQEISNKIGLSYRNTFLHIKLLESKGYLKIEKLQHKQGKPSVVSVR